MRKYSVILLALLISAMFSGCASTNKNSGILEERAAYNDENKPTPVSRTNGTVKKAWLHAHEMPTGDYFGGAWIYLLVEKTKWTLPTTK